MLFYYSRPIQLIRQEIDLMFACFKHISTVVETDPIHSESRVISDQMGKIASGGGCMI